MGGGEGGFFYFSMCIADLLNACNNACNWFLWLYVFFSLSYDVVGIFSCCWTTIVPYYGIIERSQTSWIVSHLACCRTYSCQNHNHLNSGWIVAMANLTTSPLCYKYTINSKMNYIKNDYSYKYQCLSKLMTQRYVSLCNFDSKLQLNKSNSNI